MKIVFKMLVGFAQYFLIVYLFLFLGGIIAAYFFEDFPSVNIETVSYTHLTLPTILLV